MGWNLDNPTSALENYCENHKKYLEKRAKVDDKKAEKTRLSDELNKEKNEKNKINKRLEELNDCSDIENISKYEEKAQVELINKVNIADKQLQKAQWELEQKKQLLIKQKTEDLEKKVKYISENNNDKYQELTPEQEQVFAFEKERRTEAKTTIADNYMYQLEIDNITNNYNESYALYKKEIDDITNKYKPKISEYEKELDIIEDKYRYEIQQCQDEFVSISKKQDEIVNSKYREINRVDEGFSIEVRDIEKKYDSQLRLLDRDIDLAKRQGKGTTRFNNNRDKLLKEKKIETDKKKLERDRAISNLQVQFEEAETMREQVIRKAEQKLNDAITKKEKEAKPTQNSYDALLRERDKQIAVVNNNINAIRNKYELAKNELDEKVTKNDQLQSSINQKVDAKIVDYIKENNLYENEEIQGAYGALIHLRGKINTYMDAAAKIKTNKLTVLFPQERDMQLTILKGKNYKEILEDAENALSFDGKPHLLASYNMQTKIASIVIIVSAIAMWCFSSHGLAILLLILAGALLFFTLKYEKSEFSRMCKYTALAVEYDKLPAVRNEALDTAINVKLQQLKELGANIYDAKCGKQELQDMIEEIKKKIDREIEAENNRLLSSNKVSKQRYERDRDTYLKDINSRLRQDNNTREAQISKVKYDLSNSNKKIRDLQNDLQKKIEEINQDAVFIKEFETNYDEFEAKLNKETWITTKKYTDGTFCNKFYIVPAEGGIDKYGKKNIYCIPHEKKPLVIIYEVEGVITSDSESISNKDKVSNVIEALMLDLMYSVYCQNYKEIYEQNIVIVDGFTDLQKLKAERNKQLLNIECFGTRIEDIDFKLQMLKKRRNEFDTKSIKMDDYCRSKMKKQERPELYEILYFVFGPNKKASLDKEISQLIYKCDMYGIVPIFICEKNAWEKGIQEDNSMYKELKNTVNKERIVTYKNTVYEIKE